MNLQDNTREELIQIISDHLKTIDDQTKTIQNQNEQITALEKRLSLNSHKSNIPFVVQSSISVKDQLIAICDQIKQKLSPLSENGYIPNSLQISI